VLHEHAARRRHDGGAPARRALTLRADAVGAIPTRSLASQRIEEMSDFFAFVERRTPELLVEWRAQRRA
jgi:hypothetical protein